jgi:membrane-associated phospholipid phosphatase
MNSKNDSLTWQEQAWHWGVPAFALLAMAVLALLDANVALFYAVNKTLALAGDALWIHLSMVGDGKIAILFMLPFLGRRPDVVWQFILAILLVTLWVQGMKELFSHARPPALLPLESFHLIGPALQNNSFPSGHTTSVFLLAGLLCLQRVNNWTKLSVLLLALLIGFSRIASGVHWPMDVLGGALGGWLVALGAVWLSQYWRAGLNVWAQRAFALLATPLAVWAVWSLWHDYSDVYPGTDWLKVIMLGICLGWALPGLLRLFRAGQMK